MRTLLIAAFLLINSLISSAFAADNPSEHPLPSDLRVSFKQCSQPAYPKSAGRNLKSGDTLITTLTDADGKVVSVDVVRSSGWRTLDFAVARAVIGCKITNLAPGRAIKAGLTFHWMIEDADFFYFEPAKLLAASCPASDLLRIPGDDEPGLGIVIGAVVTKKGLVSYHSIEWADDDDALTQEAVRIVKACKFEPGANSHGILETTVAIRLLPKKPAANAIVKAAQ
ncbi:TonB family protein [Undibacterium luofuense]|uniref:TonB family protein n=1 Tax=Undibacterium luofuense TaxID=2828733 RepID=UPI0030ED4525